MSQMYAVYEILNIINGKRYFGKTNDVKSRWQRHLNVVSNQQKDKMYAIHYAMCKYGIDNFKFSILNEYKLEQEALNKEIELIAQYKTNICKYGSEFGYNMTDGGEGVSGRKLTDEQRQQISQRRKGIIFSKETKEKMRQAKLGIKLTEEHKKKLSLSGKGKKRSHETKIRVSQAKLGSKNPGSKLNEKQVLEIKKLILEKIKISTIAKQYNVAPRTIRDIKNDKCWQHIKLP